MEKETKKKKSKLERSAPIILAIIVIIAIIYLSVGKGEKSTKTDTGYNKDTNYIEIEYQTKKLASDLDLFIRFMEENDSYGIISDKFKNDSLYSNFVIYGDEYFTRANEIDTKVTYDSLIIANLNYYSNDINLFLYSLDYSKRKEIQSVYASINNKVRDLNNLTNISNKSYKTDFVTVTNLKTLYPNTNGRYNKELKSKLKDLKNIQG